MRPRFDPFLIGKRRKARNDHRFVTGQPLPAEAGSAQPRRSRASYPTTSKFTNATSPFGAPPLTTSPERGTRSGSFAFGRSLTSNILRSAPSDDSTEARSSIIPPDGNFLLIGIYPPLVALFFRFNSSSTLPPSCPDGTNAETACLSCDHLQRQLPGFARRVGPFLIAATARKAPTG